MVGPTAQIIALACHFNGRVRDVSYERFFPTNSTCQYCEYVRFLRPQPGSIDNSAEWETVARSPDDWLAMQATPGSYALLRHQRSSDPKSDRMLAGFIGGGGRWSLVTKSGSLFNTWRARWEVGDQNAPEKRIWRVDYGLVDEEATIDLPAVPSLDALKAELREALEEILAFAERHRIDHFTDYFRQAITCLSAAAPFELVAHKDLAPPGLLESAAAQLLAASQAAWVFIGMGSWNDIYFHEDEQRQSYETISERLFSLLNECICAGANSTAAQGG